MDRIEYMYQQKQVKKDLEYLIKTYEFEEREALQVLIEKYKIRTEAAKDLLTTKGGKYEK